MLIHTYVKMMSIIHISNQSFDLCSLLVLLSIKTVATFLPHSPTASLSARQETYPCRSRTNQCISVSPQNPPVWPQTRDVRCQILSNRLSGKYGVERDSASTRNTEEITTTHCGLWVHCRCRSLQSRRWCAQRGHASSCERCPPRSMHSRCGAGGNRRNCRQVRKWETSVWSHWTQD